MKIKIVPASGGYRVHLVGGNGQLVFWTEVYTTKANAQQAAQWVKANAAGAPILDLA